MKNFFSLITIALFSLSAQAVDSLSYSGRLVKTGGVPVTGPVNLKFELSYTLPPVTTICSKTLTGVGLTNGVFHTAIEFDPSDCGSKSLVEILEDIPPGESIAFKVTDVTDPGNPKTYPLQAVHSIPMSIISQYSRTLAPGSANADDVLTFDGTAWVPRNLGTVAVATGSIDNSKVSATAAIARTKLANGVPNQILVNDGSGVMSSRTAADVVALLGIPTGSMFNPTPCLSHQKLNFTGAGPLYWSCLTDETLDNTKVKLSGDTMTGTLAMSGQKITNLGAPSATDDAATKAYVDSVSGGVVGKNRGGTGLTTTSNSSVLITNPAGNYNFLNCAPGNTIGFDFILGPRCVNLAAAAAGGNFIQNGNNFGVTAVLGTIDPNDLSFITGGAPRVIVSSTGDVGIGNANPGSKLDVSGALRLRGATSGYNGFQAAAVAGSTVWVLPAADGTNGQALVTDGAGVLRWESVSNDPTMGGDMTGTAGNAQIGSGVVGSTEITDGSIVNADISATAAIARAKIANGTFGAVVYNDATTGAMTDIKGTVGNQVLGMNNGNTAPEFKTITAGTGVTVTHGVGTITLATDGAAPTGAATGDLDGSYPNPTVDGIRGVKITAIAPTLAQFLIFDGNDYTPNTLSGAITMGPTGVTTYNGTVPLNRGGTGVTALTAKGIVSVNPDADGLVSTACGANSLLSFNASGDVACTAISAINGTSFIQNGNSFLAPAVLGTNEAQPLHFETNSTTKMTILTDGKVGVGTSSPMELLQVHNSTASSNSSASFSTVDTGASATDGLTIGINGNSSWLWSKESSDLLIATNDQERIRVTSAGKVGVGTATPNSKLEVADEFATPASSNLLGTYTAYGDTARFSVRSAGGTLASPTASVQGDVLGNVNFRGHNGTAFTNSGSASIAVYAAENFSGSGQGGIMTFTTVPVGATSGIERLRINHDGNIGINTPTPLSVLDINSITSGILIPRMTESERDAIAGTNAQKRGMQVFNLDTNSINLHNGTTWQALGVAGAGITAINIGTGLSPAGAFTSGGTIAIANDGVTTTQILDGTIVNADISGSAAIARTKLANGTAGSVVTNNGSGVLTDVKGTANQVLGMDGTGALPEFKTIAAGSGISVVHSANTITINGSVVPAFGYDTGEVMDSGLIPTCVDGYKLHMTQLPVRTFECVDAVSLLRAGGTMTGAIAMGTNKITGLGTPADPADAATKAYVDSAIGGAGLVNFVEAVAVAAPNVTIPVVSLTATNAATNVDVALQVKGTGAILAQIPDGTVAGGNKRGTNAVDLQMSRSLSPAFVASGNNSAIIGGTSNTASGESSFVGAGYRNDAAGAYSFVAAGWENSANGESSFATGMYSNATGKYSFAAGNSSNAPSFAQTTLGSKNAPKGGESATTWVLTDPLFVVGNGTPLGATSTALMLLKNGNLGLGVLAPVTKLEVAGTLKIGDGGEGCVAGLAGSLRYFASNLQLCNGTAWANVGGVTAVGSAEITDGSIVDVDISATAAIARTKLANATAGSVVTNDASGVMTDMKGTANQMLGMNAAGTLPEFKTLEEGTGVTLTHTAGNIKIDVSGVAPSGTAGGDLDGTYPNPTLKTVPVAKGGTGNTTLGVTKLVGSNLAGNLQAIQCSVGEVFTFDVSGNYVCQSISSLVTNAFVQNGNSFGAAAVLGTNDDNSLSFVTNGTNKLTILADGKVGIGSVAPTFPLVVNAQKVRADLTELYGQLVLSDNANHSASPQAGIIFRVDTASPTQNNIAGISGNKENNTFGDVGGNLRLYTRPAGGAVTERVRISSTGFMGVGTQTPATRLDVAGTLKIGDGGETCPVAGAGALRYNGGTLELCNGTAWEAVGGGSAGLPAANGTAVAPSIAFTNALSTGLHLAAADTLGLTAGGINRMRISSASISSTVPYLTTPGYVLAKPDYAFNGDENTGMASGGADVLTFITNSAQRLRINTNGSVGVGNHTTNGTGSLFQVNGGAIAAGPVSTSAGGAGQIRFMELDIQGTNHVGFKAPDAIASDLIWTLPSTAGTSGQVLTTNGAPGVLSWTTVAAGGSGDFLRNGSLAMTGAFKAIPGSGGVPSITFDGVPDVGLSTSSGNLNLSAGGMTRVAISGTNLLSQGSLLGPDGTAGSPTFAFETDLSKGMYSAGINNLAFSTASTERIRIDVNGNVGINQTSPGAKLDVKGGMRLSGTTSGYVGFTVPAAAGTTTYTWPASAGTNGQVLTSNGSGGLSWAAAGGASQWTTSGSNIYYTTGKVGIGTNSPWNKFDLQGNDEDLVLGVQNNNSTSARYPTVLVQNYNGGVGGGPSFTGLTSRGTSSLPSPAGSGDILFMLSGNGATNSAYASGTGAQIQMLATENFSGTGRGSKINFLTVQNATTSLLTRMTIENNGNVGIGVGTATEKLEVNGNVKATAYISTSDKRLKKNIQVVKGLPLIMQLRGVTYDWKNDGTSDMGVIAQEIEKVFPQSVTTDPNTGMKAVKYQSLIAPLIEATKDLGKNDIELSRKVSSLEKENLELKKKNEKMEKMLMNLAERLNKIESKK